MNINLQNKPKQMQHARKRIYPVILYSLFFILYSLLFTLPVHAASQSIRVSPVILPITLSPGKTATHEAMIENLSNTPLPLHATLNDFSSEGEDGGYIFTQTKQNPLLSWIKLSDDTYILKPHEKKNITITIRTPEKIAIGGYYGILFFEPVQQNTQATQIQSKVGIVMLANIGVPDPNTQPAEILTFQPQKIVFDGTIPLTFRVKNTSLNFFSAKPSLNVDPIFTMNQAPQHPNYLEEKIIFPGKVRKWDDGKTLQNLPPNIYKINLRISSGNGKQINKDAYVIVLPGRITFMIIGSIMFLLLLLLFRSRFKKALRELVQ